VDQQAGGAVRKAGLQSDLVGVELHLAGYGNDADQPVMVDAGDGHPVGAGDRPHAVGGQAHHGPADVPPQQATVTRKPEQEPGRRVLAQARADFPWSDLLRDGCALRSRRQNKQPSSTLGEQVSEPGQVGDQFDGAASSPTSHSHSKPYEV
jgi:hypothetical protein